MSKIQVNIIDGATYPVSIYISDIYGNNKTFVGTVTSGPVPPIIDFTNLPPIFNTAPAVMITMVDSSLCEKVEIIESNATPTPTPTLTETPFETPTQTPTQTPTTLCTKQEYYISNSGNFSWTDCNNIARYDYLTTGEIICICDSVNLPFSLDGGTGYLTGSGCVCPEPTPTPTQTPTETPIPTLTPTPSVTPDVTPTPTVTSTPTPTSPNLFALIFMESSDDVLGVGPANTDLATYMSLQGSGAWNFFHASGPPNLSNPNELSDFLIYLDWPGFYTGTTNVPPVIKAVVPQTSGGIDSYGNSIEAYRFITAQVTGGTTTGNIQYVVLVPLSLTNNQIYSSIGINFNNSPTSLIYTLTDYDLNSVNVTYTGSKWGNSVYRVYSQSPSNGFDFGTENVTDTINNFFRGGNLT